MTTTDKRPGILWYIAIMLMFAGFGVLWTHDASRQVGILLFVAGDLPAAFWMVGRRRQQ